MFICNAHHKNFPMPLSLLDSLMIDVFLSPKIVWRTATYGNCALCTCRLELTQKTCRLEQEDARPFGTCLAYCNIYGTVHMYSGKRCYSFTPFL